MFLQRLPNIAIEAKPIRYSMARASEALVN